MVFIFDIQSYENIFEEKYIQEVFAGYFKHLEKSTLVPFYFVLFYLTLFNRYNTHTNLLYISTHDVSQLSPAVPRTDAEREKKNPQNNMVKQHRRQTRTCSSEELLVR